MNQVREFLLFLKDYFRSRLLEFGQKFERLKNLVVAILIVKRGKYASSFLNTSFLLLVATAMIGGPIIAENNPFIGPLERQAGTFQAAVVSYNPAQGSVGTIISAKPRDRIVEYEVLGGDTLESIAEKFNISVDTIKWANNLKTNTIRPGDTLNVPPVSGIVHNVTSGDNVYSVAKRYRANAQAIVDFPFNDFADLESFALTPGQVLFVPDGVPPAEQPRIPPTSQPIAEIRAGSTGTSSFIWPTSGSISQYPAGYHMAVDIQNPGAPAIIASDGGTVSFAACTGFGYGCHVIIDHGNGYQTLYGHLSSIGVGVGQGVGQGQSIGVMGCTGRCTGTHLHFEVLSGGAQLNPLGFLK